MYKWRNWLLRLFGAKIGRGVLVRPTARIVYPWKLEIGDHSWVGDFVELYTLAPITIGAHAVISQYAYLCTGSHDYKSAGFDLTAKAIIIEDEVWVAAGAFVHPGITVSRGSVVAARAVIHRNTEEFGIYAGHPAARVGTRVQNEAAQRHRAISPIV